jgi:hypothetical protein
MNGATGLSALGTAAKDDSVAGFQAQRTGIGGDVGTTLVDDADDAERHAHALDQHAVGTSPLRDHRTDGVVECSDVLQTFCHGRDPGIVELQSVEHGAGQAALHGLLHVNAVGDENLGTLIPERRGCGLERRILRGGVRMRQRLRGCDGGAPEGVHRGGDVRNGSSGCVHAGHSSRRRGAVKRGKELSNAA